MNMIANLHSTNFKTFNLFNKIYLIQIYHRSFLGHINNMRLGVINKTTQYQ